MGSVSVVCGKGGCSGWERERAWVGAIILACHAGQTFEDGSYQGRDRR